MTIFTYYLQSNKVFEIGYQTPNNKPSNRYPFIRNIK